MEDRLRVAHSTAQRARERAVDAEVRISVHAYALHHCEVQLVYNEVCNHGNPSPHPPAVPVASAERNESEGD